MARTLPSPIGTATHVADRVGHALVEFIARVPGSDVAEHADAATAALAQARRAAASAGLAAGALALPPGPIGWLTVLPEMVGVWRIQAQLVADIARLHGRTASVTRAQMLYCLFRHSAAQAFRDLVVRAGERILVRNASVKAIQAVARKVGVSLSRRAVAGAVARWVPVIGAVGVGVYAFNDTLQVGRTAIALFAAEASAGAQGAFAHLGNGDVADAEFIERRVFDADVAGPVAPVRKRRPARARRVP